MVENKEQQDAFTETAGTAKTGPKLWFTLADAKDSEAYINWAALKTNFDIPMDMYPKPLDEEELLLAIETEAFIPPTYLANAP